MVSFEVAFNIPLLTDPAGTIRNLHGSLSEAFEESLKTLRDMVKEGTPVFKGDLRDSMSYEFLHAASPSDLLGRVFSDSRQVDYAQIVETGSRPHWPNLRAISSWVGAKGLAYPYEKAGLYPEFVSGWVSFLIGRKISRTGTSGHFMFKKAREGFESQGILQKNIETAAKSALAKATTSFA